MIKIIGKENISKEPVPFEIFLGGFAQMTGFSDIDIKQALYTLKDYYEFFKMQKIIYKKDVSA